MDIVLALGGNLFMALWGSIVRYLFMLTKRGKDLRLFWAGAASAVFMGLMVFLTYENFGISTKLSFCISGILGYTGPDAIDMVRRIIIYKRFGMKSQDYEGPVPTEQVDAAAEAGKRG
jgi:hypothetical protein